VRNADHIIAGNAYLADWARRARARVTVIPTVIDSDEYRVSSVECRVMGREPLVGWMGTRINLMYLHQLAVPLARLAACHRDLRACRAFASASCRGPTIRGRGASVP
jgi:hypothetical protein